MSKPPEVVFPKLPSHFMHLIKQLKQLYAKEQFCDCTGTKIPFEDCPCLAKSPMLYKFYMTLPYRIQLIENSTCKEQLKADLYEKLMKLIIEC